MRQCSLNETAHLLTGTSSVGMESVATKYVLQVYVMSCNFGVLYSTGNLNTRFQVFFDLSKLDKQDWFLSLK
jgi:hypothetical protein